MKITEWDRLRPAADPVPATVVIGVFDAFHRGHQTLTAAAFAESGEAVRVAVTFRVMPPGKGKPVYPFRMRLADLEAAGFDEAVVIDFNARFAALSAERFFRKLTAAYRIDRLTVGADFRCGNGRATAVADLERLLPQTAVQAVMLTGGAEQKVSASDIRRFLAQGRPEAAAAVLVRPYRLPMRLTGKRWGIRRRCGLTVLADGVYEAQVAGEKMRIGVKGALIRTDRELLVKKPIEIIILSRYKE